MFKERSWVWKLSLVLLVGLLAGGGVAVASQEAAATAGAAPASLDDKIAAALGTPKVMLDTIWTLIAGMLVFFMGLGFACVESGFCRAKNTVNILSKNFIVVAATTLAFWFVGWGIMFGNNPGGLMGTEGIFAVGGLDHSPLTESEGYAGAYASISWATVPLWTKFFFQLVFAGTAATIVSGAVAERIKYGAFIVFTVIMGIAIYPVVGHWVWGGGWLGTMETAFLDFAGSTQVHSIGGWAALAGVIVLGPRIGKYGDGKVNPILGHSMPLAVIGCFILWFGWFGFNPGSTMGLAPVDIGLIAVNTQMAASAGALVGLFTSWMMMKKPDIGMTLNGCLAGLVAITAPCAWVTSGESVVIGAIGGFLVVVSVTFFDRIKIDDPVGAISVHLVNGIWGTLAVGLFHGKNGLFNGGGMSQLVTQVIGIVSAGAYVFILSLIAWFILKATMGIRVSPEEEQQGLDLGEHGNEAYSGFQMISK